MIFSNVNSVGYKKIKYSFRAAVEILSLWVSHFLSIRVPVQSENSYHINFLIVILTATVVKFSSFLGTCLVDTSSQSNIGDNLIKWDDTACHGVLTSTNFHSALCSSPRTWPNQSQIFIWSLCFLGPLVERIFVLMRIQAGERNHINYLNRGFNTKIFSSV